MHRILLLGAGKSTPHLIGYLSKNSEIYHWKITVADQSFDLLKTRQILFPSINIEHLESDDDKQLAKLIENNDLIISMLPPTKHYEIAKFCLEFSKSMITASYVTPEMAALHKDAQSKNISIFMEMGLDPGIDHMSALKEIDLIKSIGGKFTSFKSYTGGLIAPESDDNPWNYKFTWNPRNVVLAGQGTVKYLQDKSYKYIPYHQLFNRVYNTTIQNSGNFEGYANRDSLKYLETYQLREIPNFIRGTLRRPGFCKAWNAFVQVGMTDDSFIIENSDKLTYRDFTASFFTESSQLEFQFYKTGNIEKGSEEEKKIEFLELFSNKKISLKSGTPAQILQHILEQKWQLKAEDKDMIVMQHELEYELNDLKYLVTSTLVEVGEDNTFTAMAKTVGIPVGIIAKLYLLGTLNLSGVQIPVKKEIYEPVLKELEEYGINFKITKQSLT